MVKRMEEVQKKLRSSNKTEGTMDDILEYDEDSILADDYPTQRAEKSEEVGKKPNKSEVASTGKGKKPVSNSSSVSSSKKKVTDLGVNRNFRKGFISRVHMPNIVYVFQCSKVMAKLQVYNRQT